MTCHLGRRNGVAARALVAVLAATSAAFAQTAAETPEAPARAWPVYAKDQARAAPANESKGTRDVRASIPIVTYAYAAAGAAEKSIGAAGYGLGLAAPDQDAVLGGGVSVWGSPLDRLTLIGDAQRNAWGNFSPSGAVVGRLLGSSECSWCLGALGKFKVDGFAGGPDGDEIESEVELGLLLSLSESSWHLDTNAILGRGTGDEGETDTEARLRFGRDLGRLVRVGIDGQARLRLAGPKYLPNGRTWDFAAGGQVMVGSGHFFGAFTAGPATLGVVSPSVGASAVLTLGAVT